MVVENKNSLWFLSFFFFFLFLNTVESCGVLASLIQRNTVLALSHIVGDLKPELYKGKKEVSVE